jgi:hypothetical protein
MVVMMKLYLLITSIKAGQPVQLFSVSGQHFGLVKILSSNLSNENIGPDDEVIEARYNIKVSSYRNPLLASGNIFSVVANAARSLF